MTSPGPKVLTLPQILGAAAGIVLLCLDLVATVVILVWIIVGT